MPTSLWRGLVPAMLSLAVSGCASPLVLKKYVATTPKLPALAGKSVFVEPYVDQSRSEWEESKPLPDPTNYQYIDMTEAQYAQWESDCRAAGAAVPEREWRKIGHKRNMFGMPIRDVLSATRPNDWLTAATKIELHAQGAVLANEPAAADVVVQATLRHAFLDLYMATWAHLVVDYTLTPRGGTPSRTRIHAAETRTAWTGNDKESFEVFTAAEQKLHRYLLTEVARALGGTVAPPP